MDIARFKKLPIMGIARGVEEGSVEGLAEAVIASGLETLEITMNTADAPRIIARAAKAAGKRLMIGAGTVLSLESLESALGAGATFIVMPTMVDEVMDYCTEKVIPVFPGALTPSEIYRACSAEATMVKVFPSGFFGPEYFSQIRGPFANIELMACGGVTAENIGDYFRNGASAVAFGASIFRREWLEAKDFGKVTDEIRKLVKAFKGAGAK